MQKIRSTPRKLLYWIIAGLAIRLALAPFTAHPFDMYVWYNASEEILKGGSINSTGLQLTPMLYYTLVPVAYAYSFLSSAFGIHPVSFSSLPSAIQGAAGWTIPPGVQVPVVTDPLFNLLVKIPFIISDLIGGLLIYKIVRAKYEMSIASSAFMLWFLNPMLIWVSAVWGMFDSLPALFTILSVYMVTKEKYSFAFLSLAIAFAYKLYPLVLVVPMLIYVYRSTRSARRILTSLAVFTSTGFVLFLPSLASLSTINYFSAPKETTLAGPSATFGLTYWGVAPFFHITNFELQIVTFSTFAILIVLVTLLTATKMRNTLASLSLFCTLSIASVFFSYPTVNEQWFIWLLPFFVVLISESLMNRGFVLFLSFLALVYSFINSQFTGFFLPVYSSDSTLVSQMTSFTEPFATFRLAMMGILGLVFSALLLFVLARMCRNDQSSEQLVSAEPYPAKGRLKGHLCPTRCCKIKTSQGLFELYLTYDAVCNTTPMTSWKKSTRLSYALNRLGP